MLRKLIATIVALGLILSVMATSCGPKEQSAEEFYKTATVDIIIPWAAGGNTDVVGRAYALKLHQYTGGNYVVNNKSGGAGLEGIGSVKNATPDGRSLLINVSASHILNWILDPKLGYNLDDFVSLGGSAPQPLMFWVAAGGPYKTIADLQKAKNLLIGTTSVGSNYTAGAVTAIIALGLDAKYVTGYAGGAPLGLAMTQNEIQASAQSVGGGLILQEQGMAKALFIFGNKRDSAAPDVPALSELVTLTGDAKAMNDFWDYLHTFITIFARYDVPNDKVKYVQEIVEKKIHPDPEFRSMTDKALTYKQGAFLSAADVSERIKYFKSQSEAIRTLFAAATKKYAK